MRPMQDIARLLRTGIERTSGLRENAFHWALFAQMGLAVAAVAVFKVLPLLEEMRRCRWAAALTPAISRRERE
jgi:hypothetical protein